MDYYAHTAQDADGRPLPESSGRWQPLAGHLRTVAALAGACAASPNLAARQTRASSNSFVRIKRKLCQPSQSSLVWLQLARSQHTDNRDS
jgi:hypothetical protein